jgi:hypothetical protein
MAKAQINAPKSPSQFFCHQTSLAGADFYNSHTGPDSIPKQNIELRAERQLGHY